MGSTWLQSYTIILRVGFQKLVGVGWVGEIEREGGEKGERETDRQTDATVCAENTIGVPESVYMYTIYSYMVSWQRST